MASLVVRKGPRSITTKNITTNNIRTDIDNRPGCVKYCAISSNEIANATIDRARANGKGIGYSFSEKNRVVTKRTVNATAVAIAAPIAPIDGINNQYAIAAARTVAASAYAE